MYTNICSIISKFDEFSITVTLHQPAGILISETWLSSSIPDALVALKGYTLYRADRTYSRGGGVCIYLNDTIFAKYKITPLADLVPGIEILCLKISSGTNEDFHLACVYRPPNSSIDNDIQLFNLIDSYSYELDNLIILGDFNLPRVKWPVREQLNSTDASALFIDMFVSSPLSQLISEPTRYRQNQEPSTLDLLLTNDASIISDITYSPQIGCSDHITVSATIQIFYSSCSRKQLCYYTKVDFDTLKDRLKQINWDHVTNISDINDQWTFFSSSVNLKIKQASSIVCVTANPSKPWLDVALLQKLKHKKKLWNNYRRLKNPEDYRIHRQYSNQLSTDIKAARKKYEERIVNANDPKVLYKYVRKNLSSKVTIPLVKNTDGSPCTSESDSAEVFAEKFQNSYIFEPIGPFMNLSTPRKEHQLDNVLITPEVIEEHLSRLDINSAPGPDGIPAKVLKESASTLALPLSFIFNSSFNCGRLPSDWSVAAITPIFKKGDKLVADNYRPISLLSICSKTMERIIAHTILSFVIHHNIIPLEQHGFLPGRSTTSNLLTCLNDWTKNFDQRVPTDVIYLDFSKAFDRVPKRRLLYVLDHYGIRGHLLSWLSSFLSDRCFFVRVGSSHSQLRPVISGVPQGSVLGPILFILYVADLRQSITSRCAFYADDSKIYGNPLTDHAQIQNDLLSISAWCDNWLIPLNISKCHILHIGVNNPCLPYYLNGVKVDPVDSQNDLGIIINRNLSWSDHITTVVRKANAAAFVIYKTFSCPSPPLLIKLYKTYIRPLLEFSVIVWNPYLVKDISVLEKVQRRITKLSPYLKHLPYENRLQFLHLTSLAERRIRGDLIYTFKALNYHLGPEIRSFFTVSDDTRLRGHSFKLKKEKFNTNIRKNFFCNRTFSLWNSLPDDVVSAQTCNTFKNRLDQFLGTSSHVV